MLSLVPLVLACFELFRFEQSCRSGFGVSGRWVAGVLIAFLLYSLPLAGQPRTLSRQIVFDRIDNVNAQVFLEDSYGFLWVGANGLYRYDGYELTPCRPVREDTLEVALGQVSALLELSPDSILVGTSTGLFLYDRRRNGLRLLFEQGPKNSVRRPIFSLYRDARGAIWIGTRRYLYRWANLQRGAPQRITRIDLGYHLQTVQGIKAILEPTPGRVLIASTAGMWEIGSDLTAERLPGPFAADSGQHLSIHDVGQAGQTLWLATEQGLWTYELKTQHYEQIGLPPQSSTVLTSIVIDRDSTVWLGENDHGLWRYDGERFTNYRNEPQNGYSLIDHNIHSLHLDRFDNLWIGTLFGISRANFRRQRFPFYQIVPGPNQLDNYVHRVMQDAAGGLWFRLLRLGLGYSAGLDTTLQIILKPKTKVTTEEIKSFCVDADKQIWVATLSSGLFRFRDGLSPPEYIALGDSVLTGQILSIHSDRLDERYIWITSRYGLCRIDRHTLARKWFSPQHDLAWITREGVGTIAQAEDGDFYCTAQYRGKNCAIYFDRRRERFVGRPDRPGELSAYPYGLSRHINALPGNRIGIGHSDGFLLIDATAKTAERFDRRPDFPLRSVQSFTHDRAGNWWLAGLTEICKYDGRTYHCHDASGDIERFNYRSVSLGQDGRLTFGGRNGIYSFYPDAIDWTTDTLSPEIYLTGLQVNNERHRPGPALELIESIRLPFRDNSVTFEFAALHFTRAGQLKYRYRMMGLEDQWVATDAAARTAPYTHLAPGQYTFTVQATHRDSSWSADAPARHVALTIVPPLHRTWWAYGLYLLLIGGVLLGIRHFELRRKLARAEAAQLKQLDAAKTRFYTNITHEFRTPLTVIQGLAAALSRRVDYALRQDLRRIQDNGRQLLDLVDQLLDLSKLDHGTLPVEATETELVAFLKYLLESFHSLAAAKQLELRFYSTVPALTLPIDKDKLRHIVTNLLSNAIKFTPSQGQVTLSVAYRVPPRRSYRDRRPPRNEAERTEPTSGTQPRAGQLLIEVADTGPGIPAAELPRIFDRFYQVDGTLHRANEGAGIGLALARELANLLGGSLTVTSTVGMGSRFELRLPVSAAEEVPDAPATGATDPATLIAAQPTEPAPGEANTAPADAPHLLIVEDNPDLVYYLHQLLGRHYRLTTATDGAAGLARATADHPDIILSDVMMPEMDGYELCRRLKTDLATSHIPIILLTAKADLDSRLTGLEEGADAYLAKPFEEAELRVRLKKLLANRAQLHQYYTSGHFLDPQQTPTGTDQLSARDQAFLEHLLATVEAHLDDNNFTAEALSQSLYLTYPTALRKVKAVTGLTINAYIRRVRIRRAAELLRQHPERTISAIALDVGFSSSAHFSRAFRKEMGVAPSVYRAGRG